MKCWHNDNRASCMDLWAICCFKRKYDNTQIPPTWLFTIFDRIYFEEEEKKDWMAIESIWPFGIHNLFWISPFFFYHAGKVTNDKMNFSVFANYWQVPIVPILYEYLLILLKRRSKRKDNNSKQFRFRSIVNHPLIYLTATPPPPPFQRLEQFQLFHKKSSATGQNNIHRCFSVVTSENLNFRLCDTKSCGLILERSHSPVILYWNLKKILTELKLTLCIKNNNLNNILEVSTPTRGANCRRGQKPLQ